MRNYKKLQEFVDSYNKFCSYYKLKMIEEDGWAYIFGSPATLATLYLLLHSSVENYCFYLERRVDEMVIKALELE